jgi:hypothetical protein
LAVAAKITPERAAQIQALHASRKKLFVMFNVQYKKSNFMASSPGTAVRQLLGLQ